MMRVFKSEARSAMRPAERKRDVIASFEDCDGAEVSVGVEGGRVKGNEDAET